MLIRIDKLLSECGLASRRECRELIRSGAITVDGSPALSPEQKIDPEIQQLMLRGERVVYQKYHYFMLYKPAGVITATEDRTAETVLSLLSPEHRRLALFPVGRLDKDTEGLLLLTDDGDFCHRVISPKSGIMKCYLAETSGALDENDQKAFRNGLILADGLHCLPAELVIENPGPPARARVMVSEGKYHQVRRMLASRGNKVTFLKRLSIGALILDENLQPGEYRELTAQERELVFITNSQIDHI